MTIFEQMKSFDFTTLGEVDKDTKFELECIVDEFKRKLSYHLMGDFIGNFRFDKVNCESEEITSLILDNKDKINERLAKLVTRPREYIKKHLSYYNDTHFPEVFHYIIGFDFISVRGFSDDRMVLYISEPFVLGKGGKQPSAKVFIKFDKINSNK